MGTRGNFKKQTLFTLVPLLRACESLGTGEAACADSGDTLLLRPRDFFVTIQNLARNYGMILIKT